MAFLSISRDCGGYDERLMGLSHGVGTGVGIGGATGKATSGSTELWICVYKPM